MRVSRSGYYDYVNRLNNRKRSIHKDLVLKRRVDTIFDESKGSYGSRRIVKELQYEGRQIGRFKVRRLMRELCLEVTVAKRYRLTTNSRHSFPVAPNVLNRQFEVDVPNTVWTSDISYIWTLEGWLYLAVVMDLCSRQIVGWALDKRMKTQLVLDALVMAYWRRKPAKGLLHHSDRGSQYACHKYQHQLTDYGMKPSMSRKGNCWDNSPMERFFRSLKSERLIHCRFETRTAAKNEVIDYIVYYNSIRLHSSLGYKSPMNYEKEQYVKLA